ncbi:MAG: hypothetical protein R3F49_09465 [Planctomycetota bacterium]
MQRSTEATARALRAAALAFERGRRGRWSRARGTWGRWWAACRSWVTSRRVTSRRVTSRWATSAFPGGVDAFAAAAAADPARHIGLTVALALEDAGRQPFAAAPWGALVEALGADGRRGTEAWLRGGRWSDDGQPWSSARSRAAALEFVERLGGAQGGFDAEARRALATLCALLTCVPSGYVRQAALERLREADPGAALPFVVARLADWVPEVRRTARQAVEGWCTPLHARALFGALPELERARAAGRFEDEDLARRIEALLRSQARTGLFLERLEDPALPVRRLAYRFALETEGAAVVGGVIRRALGSSDVVIATQALAALSRVEGGEDRGLADGGRADGAASGGELTERGSLLHLARTHRLSAVRRLAAEVRSLELDQRP